MTHQNLRLGKCLKLLWATLNREENLVLICLRPNWDIAAGTAWDNAAAYLNIYRRHIICPRHWPTTSLRSWIEFNFAGNPAINACDRLCVGDKCSYAAALSRAVPAAMSRVGRRYMRTRLNTWVRRDMEFIFECQVERTIEIPIEITIKVAPCSFNSIYTWRRMKNEKRSICFNFGFKLLAFTVKISNTPGISFSFIWVNCRLLPWQQTIVKITIFCYFPPICILF